jgi:hypothetical protein
MIAAWIMLMAELILPQSAGAMRIRLPDIAPYPVDDIGDPGEPPGRMTRFTSPDVVVVTPVGAFRISFARTVTSRSKRAAAFSTMRQVNGRR